MAIRGFANARIKSFFETGRIERKCGWLAVSKVVARKLDMLHFAAVLHDLAQPPGNKLEALKRDLKGYHSIRVNGQWRIIFRWTDNGPTEVDVRDYH